ncbi:MAG TPA: transporter substrate-binding domain-containing protein [Kiritimatiellia bacterium]|nr:transporter substrate-binding domain-containing protein [Kiritimatiellia bacterium]HPS07273.1 transporter substrate-binding domain-containing protein [Kiritimatiellia bacterium]
MNTSRPTWLPFLCLTAVLGMTPHTLWSGPHVRVGIYQNMPKIGVSETGKPEGIFIDLTEAIAQQEGWSLEYVQGTWAECLDRLTAKQIDLLPDTARTQAREAVYDFHQEPVLSDWVQVFTRRGTSIRSILDLDGKRVSVLGRSIQQELFSGSPLMLELNVTLVPHETFDAAFSAVARGEADAVIANRFYGIAHLRQYQLEDTAIIFYPTRLFFATSKSRNAALLAVIDKHMAAFKKDPQSVYYQSLKRWTTEDVGFRFPPWLKGAAVATVGILIFFLLWNLILKRQVASKLRDLAQRNEQLQNLCTQKERTEEALRENELKYHMLFETANDAILLIRGHRLIDCNARTLTMFGCGRDELLNATHSEFSPPIQPDGRPSEEKAVDHLNRAMTQGPQFFEWEYRRRDGTPFLAEVSLSSLVLNGEILLQSIIRDITERKRVENALRESDERFAAFMGNLPAAAFIKNRSGQTVFANRYLRNLLGWNEWEGRTTPELVPGELGRHMVEDDRKALESGPITFQESMCDGKGISHTFETTKFPIRIEGEPVWLGGIAIDITNHKRDEEEKERLHAQLIQAQKMESIGRLAGGVAHDFNNMLGVILGHAELCVMNLDPAQPLYKDLQEIRKAAEHSANLTRQLLAFARKQTITPRVLNLKTTMGGMFKMLQRLIGENIALTWQTDDNLWPVRLDPSQVDQILANLCVNARDAISGPGRLDIETRNATFDAAFCENHPDTVPGDYVVLSVRDNGCGMEPSTREHLFEPFFTTKGVGEGTGLGLATVYGIVKQNDGFITVDTEAGKGTTFKICLPRFKGKDEFPPVTSLAEAACDGHETVLLVEDEPALLNLCKRMLECRGYHVLAAATPDEALAVAQKNASNIHLLLTDVVMPEMNGRELATRLTAICPNLKCLFMSGYTSNYIASQDLLNADAGFIQKPFSMSNLCAKVVEALARK